MCHNGVKGMSRRDTRATEKGERGRQKRVEEGKRMLERKYKELSSSVIFTSVAQLGQLLVGRGMVCVSLLPKLSCSEL